MRGRKAAVATLAVLLALPALFIHTKAGEPDGDIHNEINAEITFQEGVPAGPLDPDNPAQRLPEQQGTGQTGPLSLEVVPDLFFGTAIEIFGAGTEYPLQAPRRPYIQVSDLRGTGEGWKLTVQADHFRVRDGESAGDLSLKGARIYLRDGDLRSSNKQLIQQGKQPWTPGEIAVDCGNSGGGAGSTAVVLRADTGPDAAGHHGMGAWVARWYPRNAAGKRETDPDLENSNIVLYIPGGSATKGKHSTTLTWTLTNTPA